MKQVSHLWRHHRGEFLLVLLALAVTLFFLVRMAIFALSWSDPAHRAQAPEPWMTPRYVAHSWGLAPSRVAEVLGVSPEVGDRPTLEEIAERRGVPVEQVLAEVRALIAGAERSR